MKKNKKKENKEKGNGFGKHQVSWKRIMLIFHTSVLASFTGSKWILKNTYIWRLLKPDYKYKNDYQ